jgi:hypothetical protein
MKKIINVAYIVCMFVSVVCVPLSAIFVICKLCAASAMSWLGCCIPLIITLALLPITLIAKFLIDGRGV